MFSVYEFLLLFFIYAFIGWIWEVLISLVKYKRFINRGFLIGPVIPIYGFGGLITTILFMNINLGEGILSYVITFIYTAIVCSILEYLTSFLMEKIFNNRWWDYSHLPLNINGRICILISLVFGLSCTISLKFLNPFIKEGFNLLNLSNTAYLIILIILSIMIFTDTIISFNIISGLKNISNSIIEDSTEKITKAVKKIVNERYNRLYKRLVASFPNMKMFNKRLMKIKNEIIKRRKKK